MGIRPFNLLALSLTFVLFCSSRNMMEWAYSGVNLSVPRNAGPECAEYLSPQRRWVESVIILSASVAALVWSWGRLQVPEAVYVRRDRGGRRLLLVLMSLIWGMEIGYKFSSSTVIYLLNPCHITTAMQVNRTIQIPSDENFHPSTMLLSPLI